MTDKKRIAGYGLVAAGIAAMAVSMVCLAGTVKRPVQSAGTQKAVEYEAEQTKTTEAAAKTGTISIPGLEQWTIPAGTTTVEADFYNPQKNTCNFVLTITLKAGGEILYQSKYVKPGQHLYEIELNKAMEAGEYEAVLQYDTYSVADNTPRNGAAVPFTLVVN